MFYKTGVDICNTKSMYNFLNEHYTYDTMNSWNCVKSIANNVKIYNLNLEGDKWAALAALERDDYFEVNEMIRDWEYEHKGYSVGFNGRSGGYLVLYNDGNMRNVIPEHLRGFDSYEDFKENYTDYYGTMKDAKYELRGYVELVRDFDKLCDDIRDYVNNLSKRDLKQDYLEEVVFRFNDRYYDDLQTLGFDELEVVNGQVNVAEIAQLTCLFSSFINMFNDDYNVKVENNYLYLED